MTGVIVDTVNAESLDVELTGFLHGGCACLRPRIPQLDVIIISCNNTVRNRKKVNRDWGNT